MKTTVRSATGMALLAILGSGAMMNASPFATQERSSATKTMAAADLSSGQIDTLWPDATERAGGPSHEPWGWTAVRAVTPDLVGGRQVRERYGRLPLSFEANQGQSVSTVKFLSRGSGYTLFLTSNQAVLVLSQPEASESRKAPSRVASTTVRAEPRRSAVLRMTWVNANLGSPAAGQDELPGKSNYFVGNDPAKWRTNIPTYARVRYENVYPGVDLVYYGNQGQLEYDFVVAPGANPSLITLAFEGAAELRIDATGELVLGLEGGEVRQRKPVVYQEVAGVRREVGSRHVMKDERHVGFHVSAYDSTLPLVIDPVLVYSTYMGGSSGEIGLGVAVDTAGSAYITGNTRATDFPTTSGAYQSTHAGDSDAFVTKLDASGSGLVYSTYLGGSTADSGHGIAVDRMGRAYVTGGTLSTDFPTTAGAAQTVYAGGFGDAFVTKLDETGSGLVYSTFVGGADVDGGEIAIGIAVGPAGAAYVTGATDSTDFPTSPRAIQPNHGGGLFDAFVVKLNAAGSALRYSSYLGGDGDEVGNGIAVDGAGRAYVTGTTGSSDFPTTGGAFQVANAGDFDAFVVKLNVFGSLLLYSTYLGGSNGSDSASGIAVDRAGSAHVAGQTDATDFPTTARAAQTTNAGEGDAFVAKLTPVGSGLVYSTYLGGTSNDRSNGIDIDRFGSAYVTGDTGSLDFPVTRGAAQTINGGIFDAFVTKLNASGSRLAYSTYLGGSDNEAGNAIAVDGAGGAYVTGVTVSTDFPTTPRAIQSNLIGPADAFVGKIATLPTSTDECKNGGWRSFGVFRNQGDCVSFIVAKGR